MRSKAFSLYELIEHAAVKQNGNADIQPQHGNGGGGKAAVKRGIGAEILDVKGKNIGENQPAERRGNRTGEGAPRGNAAVGENTENGDEENAQNDQHDKAAELQELCQKLKYGHGLAQEKRDELLAEHMKRQCEKQCAEQEHGVDHADQPHQKKAAAFAHAADGIQSDLDTVDTARG